MCKSEWPQTRTDPTCLCFPSAEMKGLYHNTWLVMGVLFQQQKRREYRIRLQSIIHKNESNITWSGQASRKTGRRQIVDLKLIAQLSTYNIGKKHKTEHNPKETTRNVTVKMDRAPNNRKYQPYFVSLKISTKPPNLDLNWEQKKSLELLKTIN